MKWCQFFKHSCQQQNCSFSSSLSTFICRISNSLSQQGRKSSAKTLREMKTVFPHKTGLSVPTGLRHHPEQQDNNYLVSSLVFEFSCPVFTSWNTPLPPHHTLVFYHEIKMNFHSFQKSSLSHWILSLLTFVFLTRIPLVAYCQTTKPKEHFYNRAFVTGSWGNLWRIRSLRFCSQLCQRIPAKFTKPSFHSVLFFSPRPWETELEISQCRIAMLIWPWEDTIWRKT